MYSFFILGQIPGTNLQITFQTWINVMMLAFCAWLIWHFRVYELFVKHVLTPRQPLHASQLHRRLTPSNSR